MDLGSAPCPTTFWKVANGETYDVCEELAKEKVESVEPSPDVLRFREQLLTRWPDLADQIAPWAADLGWRQPWGREDLAPYYVGLTQSYSTTDTTLRTIINLATTCTGIIETLTKVTMELLPRNRRWPSKDELGKAVSSWAYNRPLGEGPSGSGTRPQLGRRTFPPLSSRKTQRS